MDASGKLHPVSFFLGMITLAAVQLVALYTIVWVLGWID